MIEHVRVCDGNWRLPAGGPTVRDVLAIVPEGTQPPADLRAVLRELVGRGVVGLALATASGTAATDSAGITEEAARAGLPVFVPLTPADSRTLHADVQSRQMAALRAANDRLSELLRTSEQLALQGAGPEPLLRVLGDELSADVQVIEPGDRVWAELVAAEAEPALLRVRHGRAETAVLSTAGRHTALHAVGGRTPHPVLAAIRPTPWPDPLPDLIAQAAGQVTLLKGLLGEQRLRQSERALQLRRRQDEMAVRRTLLRVLMSGEPSTARVAVVECAPGEDRTAAADECEKAVGQHGVAVLCPSEKLHVIAVWGDDGRDPTTALASVARAGRAVGISSAGPWQEFAELYEQGFHALAAARHAGDRVSVDEGRPRLASLLAPAARTWARALLAPLNTLPAYCRGEYAKTARLTLSKGAHHAGERSGLAPETASKRLTAVMEHLGLTRQSLADQAVLELAFQLASDPPVQDGPESPGLHRLLQDAVEATAEAERFLAPLLDKPELLNLLVTWIKCNGNNRDTADSLPVPLHRNSIKPRLDQAGALLSRQLTHDGTGFFDLLLALILTGRLDAETVRDPLSLVAH
ncbi:helix-turn-helix domain-containing protein [Streptomyces sp. NPDC058595]|uniref:helix-turn-helix domain-containing protein n=1 Tax=Streptomyces sp. NPDC058595 TaxID=3346550 RepID=UPI0036533A84